MVVDAMGHHAQAGAAFKQQLSRLPDCERLLPLAARTLRQLATQAIPSEEHTDPDVVPCAGDKEPADGAWALQAQQRAWVAVSVLLDGLGR